MHIDEVDVSFLLRRPAWSTTVETLEEMEVSLKTVGLVDQRTLSTLVIVWLQIFGDIMTESF